jgi:hypothetical protein
MSNNQINLQNLWARMSPEQRAKYADRFRVADSIHRDSYNFGPPVVPAVKPRYTPPVNPELPITPTPPSKDVKKKDDDKQKVSTSSLLSGRS